LRERWKRSGGLQGILYRSLDRERHLTERRLHRLEVLAMTKRRARQAGLPMTTCCHTFRATGITTYLQNGGTIEHAQQTPQRTAGG